MHLCTIPIEPIAEFCEIHGYLMRCDAPFSQITISRPARRPRWLWGLVKINHREKVAAILHWRNGQWTIELGGDWRFAIIDGHSLHARLAITSKTTVSVTA